MSTTKRTSYVASNDSKIKYEKNGHHAKAKSSPSHTAVKTSSAEFSHFQRSVEDAWNPGDDEFCVLSDSASSAGVRISNSLAKKTALNVIDCHKSSQKSCTGDGARRPDVCTNAGIAEAMQRLAAQKPVMVDGEDTAESVLPRPKPVACPLLPPVRYLKQKANTECSQDTLRLQKLRVLLAAEEPTLAELRSLCWRGIPPAVRGPAWRILSGHVPAQAPDRRQVTLDRRRREYWSFVDQYYCTRQQSVHQDTYRQIHIDIPRMSPLIPLFQQLCVQEMFERILFIWAIRHPASGYVQGMNDLVTPFFIVFLQEVLPPDCDVDTCQLLSIDKQLRESVEADSFWALTRLLDRIQDNYTFAQPGIQNKVSQLKSLVQRIDAPLYSHIERQGIDFLQFAFRWMNNLLMRELPLHCTIRLWDTYLSEEDGFAVFHLYVCAAFLTYWSRQLLDQSDFQGLMLTLQNLPTHEWSGAEVNLLVAEAFRLKYTFADAPNHLPPQPSK